MTRFGRFAVLLVTFAVMAVLLQLRGHAYGADFDNDDASHLISAMMIHDWLLSGHLADPIGFATRFHAHFPLVGIGLWGPAWYLVTALWMLACGATPAAALALTALVAALLAALLAQLVAARHGTPLGVLAGACLLLAGPIAPALLRYMLDLPIALIELAAALAWAAYLRHGEWRPSARFGLLADAALLVKGNAFALAPFALLGLAFSGRWRLPRRPAFWLPLPLVGLVALPWYVKTYGLQAQGFRYAVGLDYARSAVAANGAALGLGVPLVTLPLLLAGALVVLRRRRDDAAAVAMLALAVAVFGFQCLAPAALEPRYMIPALAPALFLMSEGLVAACAMAGRAGVQLRWLLPLLLALSLAADLPVRPRSDLAAALAAALAGLPPDNRVLLIAADNPGENAAIAALASLSRPRLSSFAVRGSRLLGGGGYHRDDYRPLYDSVAEVATAIDALAIPLILLPVRPQAAQWQHVRQVAALVASDPEEWQHGETVGAWQILRRRQPAAAAAAKALLALSAPRHRLD